MSKTYITRGSGLRARKQPTTDAAIVGVFPEGSKLAVDHNVTVGEDIWHALPVADRPKAPLHPPAPRSSLRPAA